MVHCITLGVTGYNLKKKIIVFLSQKIDFVAANSADYDEMLHHAAFHLGLHCLPKYQIKGFPSRKRIGSVVEALTRDREVAGSSLKSVTMLGP